MNFLKQALNITKLLTTEGEKRLQKLLKSSLELEFAPASFIQNLMSINQELFDKGPIASYLLSSQTMQRVRKTI